MIDSDYRSNVAVLLANSSDEPMVIQVGDRIAQLILYRISTSTVEQIQKLNKTGRGANGFGSTGISKAIIRETKDDASPTMHIPNVLDQSTTVPLTPDIQTATDIINQEDSIKPYDIWLGNDPLDNRLTISIDIKGQHPTLGLQLAKQKDGQRLQLEHISPSTPATKIPKWPSTLRWSYLIEIDGTPVNNVEMWNKLLPLQSSNKDSKLTAYSLLKNNMVPIHEP